VLATDAAPAYYFYEQQFNDRGKKKTRRGFFAALKVENPHGGEIKPHERTLAKPKEDRLKLLRTVKANLSPIFGLFNDSGKTVVNLSRKIALRQPDETAKDREGTLHRLWKIDDAATVKAVTKALADRQVFIADGHHRYETAWNYLQERRKKDKKYSPDAEYNYVLCFLCPMEDPGLSVWPTHRVVEAPADLEERIAEYFDVLPESAFKKLAGKLPQPLLLSSNGTRRTLVVKNRSILKKAMPDKCAAYQDLGVSILHSLLLAGVPADQITYVKDEQEAYRLAKERRCLAAIVPATPVDAVKKIASAAQTMPQKSTYFFPKVGSGMVVHSL
jgi:uncharacterized protein (DUF1015 family)